MHDRLDAFVLYAQPQLLLEPTASGEAARLLELASRERADTGRPVEDTEFQHAALLLLAWFHLMRAQILPEDEGREPTQTSYSLFTAIGRQNPSAVPRSLRHFFDGVGDTTSSDERDDAAVWSSRANEALQIWAESGRLETLERAVVAGRRAVEEGDPGNPSYAEALSVLSAALRTLSEVTGSHTHAQEAVDVGIRARDAAEEADHHRLACLHHLGLALAHRGALTGSADDLYEATAVLQEAIAAGMAQEDEPDTLAVVSQGLAMELLQRYQTGGSMADLDGAIEAGRQAVARRTKPDPGDLSNLCYALALRSSVTGSPTDLSDALQVGQEALGAAPPGHTERPAALNNMSAAWQLLSYRSGSLRDLDRTIAFAREAVELSPDRSSHDLRKVTRLGNLAYLLAWRYRSSKRTQDIDEAIDLMDQSLQLVPRRHPKRAELLSQLADHLGRRYAASRRVEDKRRIIEIRQSLTANKGPQ
ncbi:hypothetical protein [Streptomyces sp. NPDC057623]|uniref:hypothetical protein n=1 Tax=Streptomyces sp. NPDC057623 TaxID=3346187 RepID=UPI003679A533